MMIDSMLSRMSLRLRLALQKIQSVLAFEAWTKYPAYNNNQGLGRAALISLILGVILGMHTILLIVAIMIQMQNQSQFIVVNNSSTLSLGPYRIQLLIQWCMYIICVCNFHLAEFFATSIWNPRVVSSDSFIVNHSYAYTAAAIVSTVTVTREYCGTLVVWTFFCRLVLTLSRCCTYRCPSSYQLWSFQFGSFSSRVSTVYPWCTLAWQLSLWPKPSGPSLFQPAAKASTISFKQPRKIIMFSSPMECKFSEYNTIQKIM